MCGSIWLKSEVMQMSKVEEKKKKRIGLYILIAILAIVACAGAVVTGMVIQNKKQ